MPRLIWSPQALLDVQRLYRFLAIKNIDVAQRAVQTMRQGVRVLGQRTGIGRPIEDMHDEFREWVIDFGDSVTSRGTAWTRRPSSSLPCGTRKKRASELSSQGKTYPFRGPDPFRALARALEVMHFCGGNYSLVKGRPDPIAGTRHVSKLLGS